MYHPLKRDFLLVAGVAVVLAVAVVDEVAVVLVEGWLGWEMVVAMVCRGGYMDLTPNTIDLRQLRTKHVFIDGILQSKRWIRHKVASQLCPKITLCLEMILAMDFRTKIKTTRLGRPNLVKWI